MWVKGKGKGNVYPRTGHGDLEGSRDLTILYKEPTRCNFGLYRFLLTTASILYISDSKPGFRGTLGYREHFLGVPRDVEITNVL